MPVLPRLCCLLLLASSAASAGQLYKWKDANGVTQYSERPPVGQKYETRQITQSGAPSVQAEPAAAAAPATVDNLQCASARHNLELLSKPNPVMRDTDGDGKPDQTLDDGQRQAQKRLAESMVATYCMPAASP
ncbi:DUF4124 domain-containing protein [Stenotrophomonas sp. MH1]|uniref:DUF4124 domain-containing protein n=1 Tax=Stenotrophomonas capsici TaxID=3110230 RepID=A0ABU5V8E1_9GAMM|nr:DUF4124 domain-containing protein [Stenotrophomonas sp. MH1]MEA5669619.1 DUF4124 domain-containing protein [Stenotrophomonas sp. MH1]